MLAKRLNFRTNEPGRTSVTILVYVGSPRLISDQALKQIDPHAFSSRANLNIQQNAQYPARTDPTQYLQKALPPIPREEIHKWPVEQLGTFATTRSSPVLGRLVTQQTSPSCYPVSDIISPLTPEPTSLTVIQVNPPALMPISPLNPETPPYVGLYIDISAKKNEECTEDARLIDPQPHAFLPTSKVRNIRAASPLHPLRQRRELSMIEEDRFEPQAQVQHPCVIRESRPLTSSNRQDA